MRILQFHRSSSYVLIAAVSATLIIGCGGGGGSASSSNTNSGGGGANNGGGGGNGSGSGGGSSAPSKAPTATTRAEVATAVAAYGASIAATRFRAYGAFPRHGIPYLDEVLGLYAVNRLAPDGFLEEYFTDQSLETSAGALVYKDSVADNGLVGTISITAGAYAGLMGKYLELNETDANGVVDGYSGSVTYTVGPWSIDNSYSILNGLGGQFSGSASAAITGAQNYTQTDKFAYKDDGTFTLAAIDSNSVKGGLSFKADSSGAGAISGKLPGLPASFAWTASGDGTITYADGSTGKVNGWTYAAVSKSAVSVR